MNKVMVLFFIFTYIQHISPNQCPCPLNKDTDEDISGIEDFEDANWWKTATFYQIYPKSFKDSNGDGVGDLNGVIEKLDYIKDLGVTGVWLSPIMRSPQKDAGYDISDFRQIDPIFGNLKTFKLFVIKAHKIGLRIIMDFVPNHTSDQHKWFLKSKEGDRRYSDYYVWKDPGLRNATPNNWISNFKFSAWEYNENRKKYYLHHFLREQPDLNYRNPEVLIEITDILTYYLEVLNVDGVRIDAVPFLIEDKSFKDEPYSYDPSATSIDYEYLNHIYTLNQPESYALVSEWRRHIDKLSKKMRQTKICMAEAVMDTEIAMRYYGSPDGKQLGAHFAFNFDFVRSLKASATVKDVAKIIREWVDKLPKIYVLNWLVGTHDVHRVASTFGKDRVDFFNMLTGFLPGIQVTYNGEEIGMENGDVSCQEGDDHTYNCTMYPSITRDYERTPMQWDKTTFAGFTHGTTTWLPVSAKKIFCNVEDQLKDPKSHLNVYKNLQKLRPELRQTEIEINVIGSDSNVLQIIRFNKETYQRTHLFEMLLNYGNKLVTVPISSKGQFVVALSSGNSYRKTGDKIYGTQITLDHYEGVILKCVN